MGDVTLPAFHRRYTVQEYLAFEQTSPEKHEYDDGEILAMAGGSPSHALIATNIAGELRNRLRGTPCNAYGSDLRVRVSGRPKYVYPDVTVICGPVAYDAEDPAPRSVTNPKLIVEVLSPRTEGYDRGEKFDRYRGIESLQEYVLVAQHAPRLEVFLRRPDGTWLLTPVTGATAVARLASLEVDLPLEEVYAGVDFGAAEQPERLSGLDA